MLHYDNIPWTLVSRSSELNRDSMSQATKVLCKLLGCAFIGNTTVKSRSRGRVKIVAFGLHSF